MAKVEETNGYAKVPAVANPLAEKPSDIASNINYHSQYNPHFSPFKFEPEQAFFATADSVRDRLLQNWNDTYAHFHKNDPKQTYYLSMEYLQGRALSNAIGNLNIRDAYADALNKLGHQLENITEQEKDAALGNGGLGRLASCFLDSMATLNLPAWGYGLRYRYGLFKQKVAKEGQEEIAEDWLEKFSPWEVVRHDVIFTVRFFGQVEVNPSGCRKWVGGEVLQALAYDVPIPGYKTKNTISLHVFRKQKLAVRILTYFSSMMDNMKLLPNFIQEQQICAVLYPGDATEDGKLLRLKQQFFLCSASFQEAIAKESEDNAIGMGGNEQEDVSLFYSDLMPLLVDDKSSVGENLFVWLGSLVPLPVDVVNGRFTFETLTATTSHWLHFPAYDKFLKEIDKCVKYLQKQAKPTGVELAHDEFILHVDGTARTQRVVRHIGGTSWPGRLTLTNYALYFEASGVITYEDALKIDLSKDTDQSVKRAATGPWGAPLFDKALIYESSQLSDPVVLEFPGMTSSTRREHWLSLIKEVILLHQFLSKHKDVLSPLQAWEMQARTILAVVQLHAAREMLRIAPPIPTSFLIFSLFDELPKGDYVMEELASFR